MKAGQPSDRRAAAGITSQPRRSTAECSRFTCIATYAGEPMRRLSLSLMLLLGVAACAPQQAYQPVAAAPPPPQPARPPPPAMPASAPGLGPSKNMGLNYDGRYAGVSAVSNIAGNTWSTGGSRPRPLPAAGFHAHRKCDPEWLLDDDFDLRPGVRRVDQQPIPNHWPSDRILRL
jgi:hypothetical protein